MNSVPNDKTLIVAKFVRKLLDRLWTFTGNLAFRWIMVQYQYHKHLSHQEKLKIFDSKDEGTVELELVFCCQAWNYLYSKPLLLGIFLLMLLLSRNDLGSKLNCRFRWWGIFLFMSLGCPQPSSFPNFLSSKFQAWIVSAVFLAAACILVIWRSGDTFLSSIFLETIHNVKRNTFAHSIVTNLVIHWYFLNLVSIVQGFFRQRLEEFP